MLLLPQNKTIQNPEHVVHKNCNNKTIDEVINPTTAITANTTDGQQGSWHQEQQQIARQPRQNSHSGQSSEDLTANGIHENCSKPTPSQHSDNKNDQSKANNRPNSDAQT
mmetsp:Transcript_27638/g.66585  ORF Transcript_27638/g.66585 Transcript_27638/m.66585 type:complete len:110 (-) Transcript_27638:133-462(-)